MQKLAVHPSGTAIHTMATPQIGAPNQDSAFPMEDIGTQQSDSIRIAAEKPARIWVPKPFTTDWTSIWPIETVDCCKKV